MAVSEEIIFLRENRQLWTYFLSNTFDEIKGSIHKETGVIINDIDDTKWEANSDLSQDVKDIMLRHNALYSMTVYRDNDIDHIVVNKKDDKNWLFYGGVILNGSFFSYDELDKNGLLDKG
jgi:hypothetical protein